MAATARAETLQQGVRQYYGTTLSSSADLRTSACCDASSVPAALKPLLARIHPEVSSRGPGFWLWVRAAAAMPTCWPSWWAPPARWSVST